MNSASEIQSMTVEIQRFKKEISLVTFAINEYGFSIDKERKSEKKRCVEIRSPGGADKITVTEGGGSSGEDIYKNWMSNDDKGSIIDFVQKREGINLAEVRKRLRPWVSGAVIPRIEHERVVHAPVPKLSLEELKQAWENMPLYAGSYLTEKRLLDPEVIRLFGVRQDDYGNACFVHISPDGITGWEVKNNGFTGVNAGGTKSLMMVYIDDSPIQQIVIVEAAIDALSHYQLRRKPGCMYLSTGGQPSGYQLELIQTCIANNSAAVICCSHDADEAGDGFADQVKSLAGPNRLVLRDRPFRDTAAEDEKRKDWNDVLRIRSESLPVLPSKTVFPTRSRKK